LGLRRYNLAQAGLLLAVASATKQKQSAELNFSQLRFLQSSERSATEKALKRQALPKRKT